MSTSEVARLKREIERRRTGEWAALEALEDGDVGGAVETLLALVEDGGPEALPQLPCPECGLDCHWPGRLEAHLLNVHHVELADAA